MSWDVLERLFGSDFAKKVQEQLQEAQELPEKKLEEIKKFAIPEMARTGETKVKYKDPETGREFDVVLCHTPNDPRAMNVKKTSAGNWKVGLVCPAVKSLRGPWISVFLSKEEDARAIEGLPGGTWLLVVGTMREAEYGGDTTYNIRSVGVIVLRPEDVVDSGIGVGAEGEFP